MNTRMKKVCALAIAGLGFASLNAQAGVLYQFNDASLGGSNTFNADEFTFRSLTSSVVTLTDSNNNGIIGVGDTDAFIETGMIWTTSFFKAGLPVIGSGVGSSYEVFGVFNPPAGSLTGTAGRTGASELTATFNAGSQVTLYYDTTVNGVLDLGTSTAIGVLDNLFKGECRLTGTFTSGSCKLAFNFDDLAVTAPGVWTVGGTDLGTLGATATVDVNVNDVTPPFTIAYAGYGTTCGAGSGGSLCTQTTALDHDGSNVFSIPEPGTVALLALGLLGVGGFTRRGRGKIEA